MTEKGAKMTNNYAAWMTIEETAQYLRCSLRHLRETVSKKEIPHTKFAGKVLFYRQRIDEWMIGKEEKVVNSNVQESQDEKTLDTNVLPN